MPKLFEPLRIIETLIRRGVRFVLIGGVAARAWGSPSVTNDLDVCYARDRENLEALAAALKELGATLRGVPKDVRFLLDARTLAAGDHFTFQTLAGDFDILGTPAGTRGYEELIANAQEMDFDGLTAPVASVDDLIRMKRAAWRPQDRVEVEILGALREELDAQPERSEGKKRPRRRPT